MSVLKIFEGFSLDMASDISALSKGEIRWLLKQGILSPAKDEHGANVFSFSELLMLRLVRLLKVMRVRVKNIKRARQYIKQMDPGKDLTNVMLYMDTGTHELLYLGEKPQKGILVNINKSGQLQPRQLLAILPVGPDLEFMRRDVIDLDKTLSKRLKSKKLVSMEDVFKKYGLG